jgi:hypothetical protein
MTQKFTVHVPEGAPAAALHRSVLATLPNHFYLVASGNVDAALINGFSVECSVGARILVLDGLPAALSVTPSSIVVPAHQFVPRLLADKNFAAARSIPFSLINIVVVTARPDDDLLPRALLEQLAIVRLLASGAPRLSSVERCGRGFVASGGVAERDISVTLAGFPSPVGAAKLSLAAVSRAHRLQVDIEANAMARPAAIRLLGPDGSAEGIPVYQNSHRLTWLKVHELLSNSAAGVELGAGELNEDLESVHEWLP